MGKLRELYQRAKEAKIGEECVCPSCGNKFVKTNRQQAFCKTKTGTKCKDKYWNTVTPHKRNKTTRISPASARWLSKNDAPCIVGHGDSQREIDRQDRLDIELNSGDGMDVTVERCEFCGCLICRCEN